PGLSCFEPYACSDRGIARVDVASSYVTIGSGCAGSTPVTHLVPLDTPRIGRPWSVTIDPLPMGIGILFAGVSRTTSAFGPLPLPLAPLGMPGCTAYCSVDAALLIAGAAAPLRYDTAIPGAPALVGVTFCQQALVLDAAAGNPLGAVVSDA